MSKGVSKYAEKRESLVWRVETKELEKQWRKNVCRWEEEFLLLIHDIEHQDFNARVYDNDMIGADKEVGRVKVPIRDLPSGQTVDEWYTLESPDVQRSGNPLQMGMRVSLPAWRRLKREFTDIRVGTRHEPIRFSPRKTR